MVKPLPPEDRVIYLTPDGALASAFSKLCDEAELGKSWWSKSPLLAAKGLAYHLGEAGWHVVPKKPQP